jgi:hypothetical protein
MVPITIRWINELSLGDSFVGVGTMLLAIFTWRLARATYVLDRRNADREQVRRERTIRGISRLVYGEMSIIKTTLALALDNQKWHRGYPIPRGAWDRDGAVIAEALVEDEAQTLIDFFAELTAWEGAAGEVFGANPGEVPIALPENDVAFIAMQARLSEGLLHLHRLAYPDRPEL